MRAGWISQVVKGDACEKRPNHTDSWGRTPRTCWEIGPRRASEPGTRAGNNTHSRDNLATSNRNTKFSSEYGKTVVVY